MTNQRCPEAASVHFDHFARSPICSLCLLPVPAVPPLVAIIGSRVTQQSRARNLRYANLSRDIRASSIRSLDHVRQTRRSFRTCRATDRRQRQRSVVALADRTSQNSVAGVRIWEKIDTGGSRNSATKFRPLVYFLLNNPHFWGRSVAEWLACWTEAQKARVQIAVATLSGNSLRQTAHTHHASVYQAAKLVASL